MNKLNIESNIADPDAFYEKLIDAHNGLTDEESHFTNAKLVLLAPGKPYRRCRSTERSACSGARWPE